MSPSRTKQNTNNMAAQVKVNSPFKDHKKINGKLLTPIQVIKSKFARGKKTYYHFLENDIMYNVESLYIVKP